MMDTEVHNYTDNVIDETPGRRDQSSPVHIIGAGPAGLVAAINLARQNHRVVIHERAEAVGTRFHGDFQGLDNWTLGKTVPDFLQAIRVEVNFRSVPFYGGDFYGPDQRRRQVKSAEPLFYLIERGTQNGSLDQGLLRQALDLGVEIHWNDRVLSLPPGPVIVGTGPKAADAIARGMTFFTEHPDHCAGFVDVRFAPKAYAYLLIHDGRATFATCLFKDFHNVDKYYQKAVANLHQLIDIDIIAPEKFGGYVNFFLDRPGKNNRNVYYVGENNGFQDALWGFGLKYAMFSGYLAALSVMTGTSYEILCREWIEPSIRTSLANRWIFAHLGNRGYRWLLDWIGTSAHPLAVLQDQYQYTFPKKLLFQVARRWYHTRRVDDTCSQKECECVWCRCDRGSRALHAPNTVEEEAAQDQLAAGW